MDSIDGCTQTSLLMNLDAQLTDMLMHSDCKNLLLPWTVLMLMLLLLLLCFNSTTGYNCKYKCLLQMVNLLRLFLSDLIEEGTFLCLYLPVF